MQTWRVIPSRDDPKKGLLTGALFSAPCALGRGGVVAEALKAEGDGATPAGLFPLRKLYYRPDKLSAPVTGLPSQPLTPADGWCDDPHHRAYNRFVDLPFAASHEKLWRDDDLYDLVVGIGHNDSPPVAGRGSAIFMHVARPDYSATRGCIALAREDLLALLRLLHPEDNLDIALPA